MATTSGKSAAGNSEKVERAATKASARAHEAVDSTADAAEEAASKVTPAIEQIAQKAHQAVDSAVEAAKPTAEWLTEHGEELQASQRRLVAETCSYVSAHPIKSLGIAVLTGYVLGRILRR
ncbi:hypothetical protein [Pseudazoarcus pumilus]|uniref:DUF883 domain-containing protein n=1 Tax=Pseudazoarcus pumilus TaxID=2067960 RepID=A0A2I6S6U0_9RHOO|nr:hypothetical protein [Pseudazoarcus pumilus]AUN94973.1 hypothetical protein C0099_08510 [Pseudazoarcus pumilus]